MIELKPIDIFLNICQRVLGEDSTLKIQHSLNNLLVDDSEMAAYGAIQKVIDNVILTSARLPQTDNNKLLELKTKISLDQTPEEYFEYIQELFQYLRSVQAF